MQPTLFDRFPAPLRHLTHDEADVLARSVTRYVYKGANYWSRRFRKDGHTADLFDEFISAGWLGVAKSLSTFNPRTPNPRDPTRYVKFTTYCCRSVDYAMRHLAKQLGARHARSGPIRSLATLTSHSDTPLTLGDDLPSPAPFAGWTADDWRSALAPLTPLMRRAVRLRYINNLTLAEVKRRLPPVYFHGRRRPLSKQGVANLITRALARLQSVPWLQQEAGAD